MLNVSTEISSPVHSSLHQFLQHPITSKPPILLLKEELSEKDILLQVFAWITLLLLLWFQLEAPPSLLGYKLFPLT